jgi:hypothetical protein
MQSLSLYRADRIVEYITLYRNSVSMSHVVALHTATRWNTGVLRSCQHTSPPRITTGP